MEGKVIYHARFTRSIIHRVMDMRTARSVRPVLLLAASGNSFCAATVAPCTIVRRRFNRDVVSGEITRADRRPTRSRTDLHPAPGGSNRPVDPSSRNVP